MTPSPLRLLPWTTLGDRRAGERAVRFALVRATEALQDVLRVAVSRGGRIRHSVE